MTESKFKRFGKYLILDHLVDGGMAKICRATYLGEQANKIVAIKMVQPQYSKDPSFVQMFEDELKVSFDLVHPNIAQVYDYGLVDEQLYSAMEYVDGANLKQFLDRLKEKKFVFPVEISTYIISQVCQALHYAHNYQDKLTGKSFNIIHRDISPHNIMLTYAGVVKVIDFGIAKADSNSEATQAGTIKGKLSYLAPECLDGLELDHRYDQFAVGITLWEMLCSRKLFTAKNELAVLKQIQACKVPKPSSINPNVPAELDQIILKALAKDRSQRFENMDKMNRALVKFLYSNYPEFNATDLGYFAKQLFQEEISADKKKFVEFGKIDLKPFIDDMNRSEQSTSDGGTDAQGGSFVSETARTGKIVLDLGSFDNDNQELGNLDLDVTGKTAKGLTLKNKSRTGTKKIQKRSTGAGGATRATSPKKAVPRAKTGGTKVTRVKKSGKTRVSKVKSGSSRVAKRKPNTNIIPIGFAACLAFFLMFTAQGTKLLCDIGLKSGAVCNNNGGPVVDNDDNGPTNPVTSKRKGRITFRNYDPSYDIYINGQKREVDGISIKNLKFGKYTKLRVKKDGHKTWRYSKDVMISKDNPLISITLPKSLEPEAKGSLSTSNNFSAGSVLEFEVDGEKITKPLPFKGERFPAGKYSGKIKNNLLGTSRDISFEVIENKNVTIK